MGDITVSIPGGVGEAALRYKDMCDGTKAEVVYVGGGTLTVQGGGGTQAVTQSGVWTVGLTGAHVTIDNASIPVTGTFWPGTQPVSGTFWQATQPVSGTVAVSNFPASQAVTGPLTDTQLRATAVSVSVGNFPATQYDNTAGSGTKIATVNTAQAQTTLLYDAKFSTGLTVVTAGTTAADITVVYR